jgi:hypothetical protein
VPARKAGDPSWGPRVRIPPSPQIVTSMKITVGELKRLISEVTSDYPSWDELSRKDQIASEYSDVYKEKHGIRPRWMKWDDMSDEEAEAELERLHAEPSSVEDYDYEPAPSEFDFPPPEGTVSHEEMMSVDPREELPSHAGMGQRHFAKTRLHGPNVTKR